MNDFTAPQADQVPPNSTDQPPAADQPTSSDQPPSSGQAPSSDQPPSAGYQPWSGQQRPGDQSLYRPAAGRMVAGVAAGVGQYLGVDANIVRIVFAVLTVMGGAGIPLYVAGWLLMPDEMADQSIASELISSLAPR
jgi:phage shock protein C